MSLENKIKSFKRKLVNGITVGLIATTIGTGIIGMTGCDYDKPYENKKTTLKGKIVDIKYDVWLGDSETVSKADVIFESKGKYYHFSAWGNGVEDNGQRAENYNRVFQPEDSALVIGNMGLNESNYLKEKGFEGKDIYWQKAWEIRDHEDY